MKRKLLSLLVLLMTAVTGAWATDYLYLEISGTSATLKYGDVPDGYPYYNDGTGSWNNNSYAGWDDLKAITLETITVDASCSSFGGDDLVGLFWDFMALTTIENLNNLNTSNVLGMVGMFEGCSSLTTLDLSGWNTSKVFAMGDMFSGCKNLTTLDLSGWDTSHVETTFFMFNGCTNLTTIYVGAGWDVSSVSYSTNMFNGCSSLPNWNSESPVTDKTNAYVGYGSYLVGKGSCGTNCTYTLDGYGVLTISGTGAMTDFADASEQPWTALHSDIRTIVINDGVTSIGDYAFSMCEYVTSGVSIPASVTSIGTYSFNYCTMTSLTIPSNSSLETIGSFAFNCCSSLPSATIPASVKSIGNNAFDASANLTTVTLNSSPSIGAEAFGSATVTMNLTANAAGGAHWTTFYNENYNFEADASTQIFKAALGGTALTLTELTTDQIVNKDNAVILKSTASPIVMTLTTTNSSNDFTGNSLNGVDDPAGVTAADPSTTYVLNYKAATGVGFYKLTSGKKLGVGKAYLTYSAGAREFFGFDEATGIDATLVNSEKVNSEVYDLQGRRVSQPTKGLYIVNGKKYIKK